MSIIQDPGIHHGTPDDDPSRPRVTHPTQLAVPAEETPILHDHHRHMLEVESGIAPEVIASRGYYTTDDVTHLRSLGFAHYQCRPEMGPFLVIPEWTTAGVQRGFKLKADHPRRERKTGKVIKYETPVGTPLQVDCPPTMALALRDRSRNLYVTEGSKKADAAASYGLPCVSLSGVYGFLRNKLVLDDLDDIALSGRRVRVAFDSDFKTNTRVAEALARLCGALARRGAHVEVINFPNGPDGTKMGLDDFIAAGGTPEDLEALARPWTDRAPLETPGPSPDADLTADNARLRRQVERQSRIISSLVHLQRSKALPPTDKSIALATLAEAHAKKARGEVEPDGRVRLESRHIANDHRPIVAPGSPKPETNADGSVPLTDRKRVKGILAKLEKTGALDVNLVETIKTHHATGDRYRDTDLLVTISDDLADDLARLMTHAGTQKSRKPYTFQEPCQSCGHVHSRIRRTYCNGCGAEYESPKHLPIPIAPDMEDAPSEPETMAAGAMSRNGMGDMAPPPPAPPAHSSYMSSNGMANTGPRRDDMSNNDRAFQPPVPLHPSMPGLADQFRANGWD